MRRLLLTTATAMAATLGGVSAGSAQPGYPDPYASAYVDYGYRYYVPPPAPPAYREYRYSEYRAGPVAPGYSYAPPRAYGYVAPRAYGYVAPGAYGYVAPGAYGYVAPRTYGYVTTYSGYGYRPDYPPGGCGLYRFWRDGRCFDARWGW
jgi:hypothetical protein